MYDRKRKRNMAAKVAEVEASEMNEGNKEEAKPSDERAQASQDSGDEILRAPVFLNRNRRKMKQIRKHLLDEKKDTSDTSDEKKGGELTLEHGLVVRQVPYIRKLFFDENTTDFMSYKRAKTSYTPKELQVRQVKTDYLTSVKLAKVLGQQKEMAAKAQGSSTPESSERRLGSQDV